jgi:hypothetical protein
MLVPRSSVQTIRLHLDEVDDAAEVLLLADRQLHRYRVRAEPVDHRLHRPKEVRRPVRSILLMNAIRGTLYLSACRQTVSDCGSTPGDRVEDGDRAVEDAQAALDLDGEVHVPGRIDDVDPEVAPERRRRRPT